ncbi:hypothetical protein CFter6_3708 [Collimonas fungivorans]|uniref:Uncharacterized protein n=1 Tax=Collimonas fungivorans TaxID=158899 RepID=A0A127PET9_9BURK|nr:hypothetical protein CFter6_3708 [Collimonas fungivorans]
MLPMPPKYQATIHQATIRQQMIPITTTARANAAPAHPAA